MSKSSEQRASQVQSDTQATHTAACSSRLLSTPLPALPWSWVRALQWPGLAARVRSGCVLLVAAAARWPSTPAGALSTSSEWGPVADSVTSTGVV